MAENNNTPLNEAAQKQSENEQRQIRIEKLEALQAADSDPFVITTYDQTHHSDEVKALYTAHEEELLAGRQAVNTDGMDEAGARQAVNDDYNERRAIMDASPINVSIAGRMMFKRVMGK
ncbi:MAG: lysine--tRNA ligase, partial [Clostridia bacterium]|nr:lysine--tRNA ligase [Clostridia bacterium]